MDVKRTDRNCEGTKRLQTTPKQPEERVWREKTNNRQKVGTMLGKSITYARGATSSSETDGKYTRINEQNVMGGGEKIQQTQRMVNKRQRDQIGNYGET